MSTVRLAIDFDGVLHDYSSGWTTIPTGPPLPGAKKAMEEFKARGFELIIYSCRKMHIESWMRRHGIPYDGVALTKPMADAYIDDRAIRFTHWGPCFVETVCSLAHGHS
jgi:hypothetical protein